MARIIQEQREGYLAKATGLPVEYVGDFLNKAGELGLSPTEGMRALVFAQSVAGDDLDSWIYSGEFEMYVEMVVNA